MTAIDDADAMIAAVQADGKFLYEAYVLAQARTGSNEPPWTALLDDDRYAWTAAAKALIASLTPAAKP